MKLNQDCVRDILLDLEKHLDWKQSPVRMFQPSGLETYDSFKKFGDEVFIYTLTKLCEAEFVIGKAQPANNTIADFEVRGITWEGHKFLDTIRDPEVWSKTKKVTSHLESVSITLLSNIGSNVLNHMVDKLFL